MQKNSLVAPGEIVREALSKPTIFKNEEPLSLEWLPPRLPHRETQLRFLTELFRSVIDKPGTTSPKVLITGEIGTGKTVLTQRFGMDIQRTARTLKQNLQYIHVNCREFRGSLFMILKQVLQKFTPQFPQRGFSSEELLHILLDQLETKNLHIILTLDEADVLIAAEGSTSLYNLTRIQEERPGRPIRSSLIVVLREIEKLQDLDRSTQSTLQRNLIRLVRAAAQSVYPVMRTDYAQHLNLHEKLLLLGLARTLERTQETYASMGESEIAYKMACEEYKEQPRAHTQVWKYVQNLSATGIVSTQPSTAGFRGKTTLLGLPTSPASAIRRWLESSLVRRP